jgi:hypothetical protein
LLGHEDRLALQDLCHCLGQVLHWMRCQTHLYEILICLSTFDTPVATKFKKIKIL